MFAAVISNIACQVVAIRGLEDVERVLVDAVEGVESYLNGRSNDSKALQVNSLESGSVPVSVLLDSLAQNEVDRTSTWVASTFDCPADMATTPATPPTLSDDEESLNESATTVEPASTTSLVSARRKTRKPVPPRHALPPCHESIPVLNTILYPTESIIQTLSSHSSDTDSSATDLELSTSSLLERKPLHLRRGVSGSASTISTFSSRDKTSTSTSSQRDFYTSLSDFPSLGKSSQTPPPLMSFESKGSLRTLSTSTSGTSLDAEYIQMGYKGPLVLELMKKKAHEASSSASSLVVTKSTPPHLTRVRVGKATKAASVASINEFKESLSIKMFFPKKNSAEKALRRVAEEDRWEL